MKKLKIALAVVLSAVVALLLGCAAKNNNTSAAQTVTATVQRGNIQVTTTSAGNLAFVNTQNVAFNLPGINGAIPVTAVNVQVGDSVKKGDVLATLDNTVLQSQISTLQSSLAQAETGVISAQISLKNSQIALETDLGTVQATDVQTAQANVDSAQAYLQYAIQSSASAPASSQTSWARIVSLAQSQLQTAENKLNALLTNADSDQITLAKMQVEIAQGNLASAQARVTTAQTALTEASAASPEVTAPFDGIITAVSVSGGDNVYNGQVAATIADPTQFEAVIPVGENDALSLQVGGASTVSVNALSNATLPAKIIAISPTATIQSGVVNYNVTVQITSDVPVSGASQFGSGLGSFTGSLSQTTRPSGATSGSGQTSRAASGTQFGQGRTGVSGNATRPEAQPVTLKQGLSVVVNLVTSEATNVLMVPNRAIITQSGKKYVNVEKNGTTSQVEVTTGISNTTYTEITSGLNQGDTIVIPSTTTSTSSSSSSSSSSQRGGGVFFPGGGLGR